MELSRIISLIFVPLGILCLFRPFLLLFLLASLPVLIFVPKLSIEESQFKIIQLGSMNIFVQDYLILIMIIMVFFFAKNLMIKGQLSKLFKGPITKLVIAVFIWSIFIGIMSYLKGLELQNVLRKLSNESLMFIAILIPQIRDIDIKKERFFKFAIILGLVFVFFALWRYGVSHEVEFTSSGTLRTLLGNDVAILLFPICYILFYSDYFRKHRILSVAFIAFFAIGVHFTGHRSGYIAIVFVLLMWLLANRHNNIEMLWVPLWGVALLIIFVYILPFHILPMHNRVPGKSFLSDLVLRYNDMFNLENRTTQERLSKWKYSAEILKESPLLGLGRFPVHTDSLDESNLHLESFAELNKAVHNIFFKKLLHEGLLGLSIIIFFFYFILKQFQKPLPSEQSYYNFLKVYILSFIIFSMFNTSFTSFERVFFFISVGFLNAEVIKDSCSIEQTMNQGNRIKYSFQKAPQRNTYSPDLH